MNVASPESRAVTKSPTGDESNSIHSNLYGAILKSSALIGGSQVAGVALGILRTKVLAVLLGPAGLGLMGLYMSITGLVSVLAGMGISTSGVREIAESTASDDQFRVARTVKTLRTTALFLGALGALVMALFCRPISRLTFGNSDQAGAVALLSLTVFFASVSGGQTALIQGMRRIRALATASLLSAFLGVVCSLPLVFWLREKGIVPMLLAISIATVLPSWWCARKVRVADVNLDWRGKWRTARSLLRLGFVFMVSGLLATGAAYWSRIIIRDQLGLDAVGIYFAAWTLAAFYVRFILQAMAADFYPRLTAAATDPALCTRLVNEQAEIALLLAFPGIMATLAFAPVVIGLFYSAKFALAVQYLRWQILGVLFQLASMPMGFIIMAQGRGRLFMGFDVVNNLAGLVFLWLGVRFWGLPGAGIAFFAQYSLCWLMDYVMARSLIGFRFSPANRRIALVLMPVVLVVFLSRSLLSEFWSTVFSGIMAVLMAVFSFRTLLAVLGPERVADLMLKVRNRFGWVRERQTERRW